MYHQFGFQNLRCNSVRAERRIEDVQPQGAVLDLA